MSELRRVDEEGTLRLCYHRGKLCRLRKDLAEALGVGAILRHIHMSKSTVSAGFHICASG